MIKPINIKIYKNLQNIDKVAQLGINQSHLKLVKNLPYFGLI